MNKTLIATALLGLGLFTGCSSPDPRVQEPPAVEPFAVERSHEECWVEHMTLLQDHVFGDELRAELHDLGCAEYLTRVTDVPNYQQQGSCTLDANNEMYCEGR